MWFTSSWDDGHPLDARLADLLAKYGIGATFYCPLSNREGLPVMSPDSLRRLGESFEIGGHTLDHAYSSRMPPGEWAAQVRDGKRALEDILGREVAGFCYPGGKNGPAAREAVEQAGFRYARTTQNMRLCVGTDPWALPTTVQLFDHSRSTMVRNLVSGGNWSRRVRQAAILLSHGSLKQRLEALLAEAQRVNGVLHVWGHSWELEAFGLWEQAESLFRLVANCVPPERRVANADLRSLMLRA
jgi:peptidoglycan/xylan/chitin deacetylase (PgdA/CDA1 family)